MNYCGGLTLTMTPIAYGSAYIAYPSSSMRLALDRQMYRVLARLRLPPSSERERCWSLLRHLMWKEQTGLQ